MTRAAEIPVHGNNSHPNNWSNCGGSWRRFRPALTLASVHPNWLANLDCTRRFRL